ncbi:MAG: molybdenum cofactor guanylyltransferase [Proteobacteria bacterium]|nr:molybdenum cofactor guanylyltransferase [Pseudomonadota bacterium]
MPINGVTCIILAGGQGKRMGGSNKALIPFKNHTLIEHLIEVMRPQVDEIIISANQDLAYLKKLGYPVIEDKLKDQGPLIGIVSVADEIKTNTVVVTPCDVINIPIDYVEKLIANINTNESDITIAKTSNGIQYLNCALRVQTINDLKIKIALGTRKVSDWQSQLKTSYVEFNARDGRTPFMNLNQPRDFVNLTTL